MKQGRLEDLKPIMFTFLDTSEPSDLKQSCLSHTVPFLTIMNGSILHFSCKKNQIIHSYFWVQYRANVPSCNKIFHCNSLYFLYYRYLLNSYYFNVFVLFTRYVQVEYKANRPETIIDHAEDEDEGLEPVKKERPSSAKLQYMELKAVYDTELG